MEDFWEIFSTCMLDLKSEEWRKEEDKGFIIPSKKSNPQTSQKTKKMGNNLLPFRLLDRKIFCFSWKM